MSVRLGEPNMGPNIATTTAYKSWFISKDFKIKLYQVCWQYKVTAMMSSQIAFLRNGLREKLSKSGRSSGSNLCEKFSMRRSDACILHKHGSESECQNKFRKTQFHLRSDLITSLRWRPVRARGTCPATSISRSEEYWPRSHPLKGTSPFKQCSTMIPRLHKSTEI